MRFSRALAAVALTTLLAGGARFAGAAAPGPVDDPGLIARAKAEGTLVFYASGSAEQLNAVNARFEAAYGIKVQPLYIESDRLPVRIITEERGGRNEIDVAADPGFPLDQLRREGMLAVYKPPEVRDLLAGTYDPSGYYASTWLNTEAIAYNPERVRAAGLKPPTSWQDLTGKGWRGQIGLFATAYEWYAAMERFYGKERGDALMRGYAANQPRMLAGHTLGVSQTETGEVLAAASVYGYDVIAEKDKGRTVDLVNPTPTVIELYAVAVMKTAPHPNAARLFERWFLSRDTQQWVQNNLHRISPRKDVRNDVRLLNPKVQYVISNPSDSATYGDDIKAFKAIFNIPG
jgi:iron(III) transport system substrate-binding protein